ncbi:MAG: hypothetical protein IKS07_02460, partial [Lachnospiraceae bacterium]|nr:hypothetical protein [Lachnospiraceae bacterium]
MRILAESRRRIAAYLAGLVFVAVLNLLVPKIIPLYNTTTLGYSVLLIIWTVTIRMRVVDREQRALFFFGGALWLLLFFTRFLKYRTAEYNPEAARYLWYFYYLPFALAPAVTLHSSIVLGNRQSGRKTPHSLPQAIWIFSGLLAVMVVTNDLHRLVFRFDSVEGYASYHYGPGYWVIIGWSILGLLVSFIIYQVKCSRTIGWHRIVPVVIGAAGIALLVWYVIEGGSPKVGGISLYNIQEV